MKLKTNLILLVMAVLVAGCETTELNFDLAKSKTSIIVESSEAKLREVLAAELTAGGYKLDPLASGISGWKGDQHATVNFYLPRHDPGEVMLLKVTVIEEETSRFIVVQPASAAEWKRREWQPDKPAQRAWLEGVKGAAETR